ncbi:MAG TPA: PsbP-related protein [Candidatus Nanoarchaeia archaeon]|nr:PsbP-related protein [Candidatus Nanoarchaeia archaeon]
MKSRNLILLALVVVGITLLPGCSGKDRLLTYTNPAFSIQYPSDWTQGEEKGYIAFLSPMESSADLFRENINIGVVDMDPANPPTLDEITKSTISAIKTYIADINLVDSSETALSGYPAHKVIYTGKPEGTRDLKLIQIWTLKDNKLYVITFTADVNNYANYLGIINMMFNSFKIT